MAVTRIPWDAFTRSASLNVRCSRVLGSSLFSIDGATPSNPFIRKETRIQIVRWTESMDEG